MTSEVSSFVSPSHHAITSHHHHHHLHFFIRKHPPDSPTPSHRSRESRQVLDIFENFVVLGILHHQIVLLFFQVGP